MFASLPYSSGRVELQQCAARNRAAPQWHVLVESLVGGGAPQRELLDGIAGLLARPA